MIPPVSWTEQAVGTQAPVKLVGGMSPTVPLLRGKSHDVDSAAEAHAVNVSVVRSGP